MSQKQAPDWCQLKPNTGVDDKDNSGIWSWRKGHRYLFLFYLFLSVPIQLNLYLLYWSNTQVTCVAENNIVLIEVE